MPKLTKQEKRRWLYDWARKQSASRLASIMSSILTARQIAEIYNEEK